MSTGTTPTGSLFERLREKAERHVVYPLNRDECLVLLALAELLLEAREDLDGNHDYVNGTTMHAIDCRVCAFLDRIDRLGVAS